MKPALAITAQSALFEAWRRITRERLSAATTATQARQHGQVKPTFWRLPQSPWAGSVCAAMAGSLAVAGWAPWAWWPLVLAAYAALFWLLSNCRSAAIAGLHGLSFGLGMHITGHGWFYTALVEHVAISPSLALLCSALVMSGLALFTALPSLLYALVRKVQCRVTKTELLDSALFASLMTMGEMTRPWVFDRYSSLSVGYSLIDTWLASLAPVLGNYGLSWLGLWLAAMLALLLPPGFHCWRKLLLAAAASALVLLSGWALQQHTWTVAQGSRLSFRLLQPNTLQSHKFDPAFQQSITDQVLNMLLDKPADLVVSPETAFPLYWHELSPASMERLQAHVQSSASHLIFGLATTDSQGDGYNSMLHMAPGQTAVARYNKRHLFPFGEYTPSSLAWLSKGLAIPMQGLSPGTAKQAPFQVNKGQHTIRIGTLVCNENMLSDEARAWAPQVGLLINPGNMAWFDGTLAIAQNLQIARMRALEVGRPVLRIANTGESALILASGQVAQRLPAGVAGSLEGEIQGETGLTPYARWGDRPVWLLCLLCSLSAMVRRYKNH